MPELADLLALLGGDLLLPHEYDDRPGCVRCGVCCDPIRPGVPTLCARCSCEELGETWPGLAHRVSHGLTRNQWGKLDTTEDIPPLRYQAWRRRHFGR